MKTKYSTSIITSAEQVPPGYVPVPYFQSSPLRSGRPWKTVSKVISDAHSEGIVRAVKLVRGLGDLKTGPVFVHREDTEQYLAQRYGETPQAETQPPADFDTLRAAIESLTHAVNDLRAAMELRAEAVVEEAAA